MVNNSLTVYVGEVVRVGEEVRLTIDCSQLIDAAIGSGNLNPDVTWYGIHGLPITNLTSPYAEVSADNRQLIFPETLVPYGAHLGIDGNYTCEVCSDADTCVNNSTTLYVCGKQNLLLFVLLNY